MRQEQGHPAPVPAMCWMREAKAQEEDVTAKKDPAGDGRTRV